MNKARLVIIIVGIILPYLARMPKGAAGLAPYIHMDIGGFLFLGACNALAWGGIVALSFFFRRPASLVIPCVLGFGFLAWAHYQLDLAADAQAALALIFIPIVALLPIIVGGLFSYLMERRHRALESPSPIPGHSEP